MTADEQRVCAAIASRQDGLVALAAELVRFDTTAREVGDPARDESALQGYLAERLARAGAEIDLFEPDAAEMAGAPLVPPGLDFAGRPQLIARMPGSGPARPALLFNGHIDVVSAEPRDEWTSDPFAPRCATGGCTGGAPAT